MSEITCKRGGKKAGRPAKVVDKTPSIMEPCALCGCPVVGTPAGREAHQTRVHDNKPSGRM